MIANHKKVRRLMREHDLQRCRRRYVATPDSDHDQPIYPNRTRELTIDGPSREKLFSRILTTDDCKFGDDAARCRLIFPRSSPDYRRFVVAFRRGRTAHVEVQNAAVMQMSQDLSLAGFTRKVASG